MFDDYHGELARLLLDQIAFLDGRIARLAARAAELTAAMPEAQGVDADGTTGPDAGATPGAAVLNAVARLAEIPGISPDLARAIIAETGLDMSRFPTAAHLVSWAGLCPSARQSGPRIRAGKWPPTRADWAAIAVPRARRLLSGLRMSAAARDRRGKRSVSRPAFGVPVGAPGRRPLPDPGGRLSQGYAIILSRGHMYRITIFG